MVETKVVGLVDQSGLKLDSMLAEKMAVEKVVTMAKLMAEW